MHLTMTRPTMDPMAFEEVLSLQSEVRHCQAQLGAFILLTQHLMAVLQVSLPASGLLTEEAQAELCAKAASYRGQGSIIDLAKVDTDGREGALKDLIAKASTEELEEALQQMRRLRAAGQMIWPLAVWAVGGEVIMRINARREEAGGDAR